MDSETRQLWQKYSNTHGTMHGVFRQTGSKGCTAPYIEPYKAERRKQYIAIIRPERTAK